MTEASDSDEAEIIHRRDDGVTTLTINRPKAGNALSGSARDALIDHLAGAGRDPAVRAVVIGAAGGRAFCTGADLRASGPTPERPAGMPDRAVGEIAGLIRDGAQRLIAAVLDCPRPVVAAVEGTAAGLGTHLALACDLVVASRSSRFIEVFVRRGIAPDGGGAYLLARTLGLHRAKELALLGDDLPATKAAEWGLVNRLVDDGEVDDEAAALAARLATGPTTALAMTKQLLNSSLDSDRAAAFAAEAWVQEMVVGTQDATEGIASFRERRDPEFRGW